MAREFKRSDRVADAIQRSLANIIQQEMRDPRLGMVNITAVTVAKDLTTAKVFVTFVGVNDQDKADNAVKILNQASSFLRSLMAKDLNIRTTPRLHFYFDTVTVSSQKMSELIDKAVAEDKSHHQNEE